jgi:YVTN family beta-propeller protein
MKQSIKISALLFLSILIISFRFNFINNKRMDKGGGGGQKVASNLVMTTNWGEDNCSIVDLKKGQELSRIKVSLKPYDIKIEKQGRFAYVSCSGSSQIAVIDIQANLVSHYIKTGESPRDIEITNDSKIAVTANSGSNDISVIDLVNKKEKYRVKVGNIPYGVALSNDEKLAVITCWGSNEAMVVSSGESAGEVIKTVKIGVLPYTAVIPHNSSLAMISTFGSGEVFVIDINSGEVVKTIEVGKSPWGMAASSDGNTVAVANFYSGDVSVLGIDRTTNGVSEKARIKIVSGGINSNSEERRAKNAIISDDGKWGIFSDLANNQLLYIDITTQKVIKVINVGKAPYGLAFIPRKG